MKVKLVAGVIVFFVIISVVIVLVEAGPSAFAGSGGSGTPVALDQPTTQPTTAGATNPIVQENAQPGSIGWHIPQGLAATTQIQAYAGTTSVSPGQSITFYVSTQQNGTSYRLDVYRLGWYDGTGARLMTSVPGQIGLGQGVYDSNTGSYVTPCPTCVQFASRRIEANWKPSIVLPVPSSWTSGVYLAKFTDVNSMQTYATFDVRGNLNSTYVAVTPDTTYAAYNTWGGWSLYQKEGGTPSEGGNAPRATEVSFNRPYVYGDSNGNGASQVLTYEVQAIRWMEKQGYNVSYMSSVDLDANPGQLLHHKAYLSLGHDEYWTKSMRDGVQNARDQGVGLIFMGADADYWQMRFAKDSKGVSDRTIVCYKVQTANNDLNRDPMYGQDNSVVTSEWRDPVVNRPENALVGIMFSDLTHRQFGFPWRVDPGASKSPLLKDTGLQPGQSYGCGVVGYEWDNTNPYGAPPNNVAPKGLHILSTTNTVASDRQAGYSNNDTGNTTYYVTSSGAMVFASGSIYWGTTLDSYRAVPDPTCGSKNTAVPEIQALMANVMQQAIVKHPAYF